MCHRFMVTALSLLALLTVPASLGAADAGAPRGYAYRPGGGPVVNFIFPQHAFSLEIPKDWELLERVDDDPMVPARIAVAVPSGQSVPCSVMITSIERRTPDQTDAATRFNTDEARMRSRFPDLLFEKAPQLLTSDGRTVVRIAIRYGRNKPEEGVAAIEEPARMMLAHMACLTAADYEKYLPGFIAILGSYRFTTSAVQMYVTDEPPAPKSDEPDPAATREPASVADEADRITPYFDDFWFGISTPAGWEHQHLQGPQGLVEAWVPAGKSWDESECRLYVNATDKRQPGLETIDKVIASDYENLKNEGSPNARIKPLPSLPVLGGKHAEVRKFTGDSFNNVEAIAYPDEEHHVATLVMTCTSERSYKTHFPAFAAFVASYEPLSENFNTSMLSAPALRSTAVRDNPEIRVHFDGMEYGLNAPEGWVLDSQSGKGDGIEALAYPKGGSWEIADPAVYVNFASKTVKGNETLDRLIATDFEQLKQRAPKLTMSPAAALMTSAGMPAKVNEFFGNLEACCERVAYIDTGKVIAILTLTARNRAAYDAAIPAFQQWVAGFKLISPGVETKPSPGK